MSYAHWSVRVVAFLIDWLACAAPNIIAGVVDPDSTGLQVGLLFLSVALLAYNRWYLGGRTGQSWGKQLMDLHLGGLADGEPIGPPRAFLRDVAHLLDTLPCYLGWAWPIWDRRKQTFADKVMSTAVRSPD
ncbi:RDD family protein [Kitasatospora viridis]|uniref:RDD family protein n=1 Tax=Kitasatospora viridis TaxID=281105 RepID=A0A561UPX5_9ACTN|nr:RDD family protein [Kitasatospora viridis]TWG01391.1 RDD family protein [Kitasatospora viridis]